MVDKFAVKGSTRKHRSNRYVALWDETREEVKKRQREAYYRNKITKKSMSLETENKENEAENCKDRSSQTSYVKDEYDP